MEGGSTRVKSRDRFSPRTRYSRRAAVARKRGPAEVYGQVALKDHAGLIPPSL